MGKAQQRFNIFVLLCLVVAHMSLGSELPSTQTEPDQCEVCNSHALSVLKESGFLDRATLHNVGLVNKEHHTESSYWTSMLESKIVYNPNFEPNKDNVEVFSSGTKYLISLRNGKPAEVEGKKPGLYSKQNCKTGSGDAVVMCDAHLSENSFWMAGITAKGALRAVAKSFVRLRGVYGDTSYDVDVTRRVGKAEDIVEEVKLIGGGSIAMRLANGRMGSLWKTVALYRPKLAIKHSLQISKESYAAVGNKIYMDEEGHIFKLVKNARNRNIVKEMVHVPMTTMIQTFVQKVSEAKSKNSDQPVALTLRNMQSTFISAQDGSLCLAIQLKGIDNNSKQYKYSHTRFFCKIYDDDNVIELTAPAIREEIRSVEIFRSKLRRERLYHIMALTYGPHLEPLLNVVTYNFVTKSQEFDVVHLSGSALTGLQEKFSDDPCLAHFHKNFAKNKKQGDKKALRDVFLKVIDKCVAKSFALDYHE